MKEKAAILLISLMSALCFSAEKFEHPVSDPVISQIYNNPKTLRGGSIGHHTGVDYAPSSSLDIQATASGVVHEVITVEDDHHRLGNTVIIGHQLTTGGNVYSLYGHLESIAAGIEPGKEVHNKEKIAVMGETGPTPGGVHLHFEIKDAPILHNPASPQPRTCYGYTPTSPSNWGYHNPADYIGKKEVVPPSNLIVSDNIFVHAAQTSHPKIYALPNEYGGEAPFQSEKNFQVKFSIKNNGNASVALEGVGALISKSGISLFTLPKNEAKVLGSGEELDFNMRGYLTENHLEGNSSVQFKAEVRYKKGGSWSPVSSSGNYATFKLYKRPDLAEGFLVKKPRPGDSNDPDLAKIYYHQYGRKWAADGASLNGLIPDWENMFYVYPETVVDNLAEPEVPSYDPTVPVFCGKNMLYKNESSPEVFIIEPEGGELKSREFADEGAFFSYDYSSTALSQEVISFDEDQFSWLQQQYPVGSVISATSMISDRVDIQGSGAVSVRRNKSGVVVIGYQTYEFEKNNVRITDAFGRVLYWDTGVEGRRHEVMIPHALGVIFLEISDQTRDRRSLRKIVLP